MSLLERHLDAIVDRLAQASRAATAAEARLADGNAQLALELLFDELVSLQETVTLIRLCVGEALKRGG